MHPCVTQDTPQGQHVAWHCPRRSVPTHHRPGPSPGKRHEIPY